MTVQVALVGDPIGHSLSPAIHGAAFAATGLDWAYHLVTVPRDGLAAAWPQLSTSFRGINVTTPHKREAVKLVDSLSEAARDCASVNTVTFEAGATWGDSTDGSGFLAALRRQVASRPRKAVVLGTGGSARSVAAALAREGTKVLVLGRNRAAGCELVQELARVGPGSVGFGGQGDRALTEALADADLLVNSTVMGGPLSPQESPISAAVTMPPELVVFDLVYWPRDTPLRRRAEGAGCQFVDGLEMLVEQAAGAFQSWTGRAAPLEVMRRAAQRAGAAR
ncbi:MAG: shikimate dehydrogenase [Candidatus Dormibacteria bacterium]